MLEPPKQEGSVLKNINLEGWPHEKDTKAVWNVQTISTIEERGKKDKVLPVLN
jgi:hypothetical protein